MPEGLVEQFLELPENQGFKLYRVEFDKQATKTSEDGTVETTTYPVSTVGIDWIDKKDRRFTKFRTEAGINKFYLLAGKDKSFLIEFHFFSHYDSDVYFAGITKVPNLNSIKDKKKWQTIALYSRIRPTHIEPNEKRQTPSVGITLSGGRDVSIEVAGEKDATIESFYRKLTRGATT